jgi:hypothetical protein
MQAPSSHLCGEMLVDRMCGQAHYFGDWPVACEGSVVLPQSVHLVSESETSTRCSSYCSSCLRISAPIKTLTFFHIA